MGSIYKRGNIQWIKYYQGGKARRESSGSTKESDAKRLLKLREGDVVRGVPITPRVNQVTLGELYQDVVADYKKNARKSLRDLQRRFDKHILHFFGETRRAVSITTSDVNRYIERRLEEGAKNGGINRELTSLKRAYSLALECDPPKLMRKLHISMLKEDNVRQGFFEPDQFLAVVRWLPDYLKGLICFMYLTGWRKSEARDLQWPQVDFDNGCVRLEPGTTKNDQGRTFPFTAELRSVLEEQREYTTAIKKERSIICPWVFHRSGKPVGDFRKAWKTACEKAGIPGRIPHDLRRTAVRNLVRFGVPERVAMQLTGHKTRSVFERYNIVSEKDLQSAAERLDSMGTVLGTIARSR